MDPLEQFYGADDRFRVLRNSDVRYLNGTAESLPVEDDVHDLVICENFLDRVGRPRAALAELWRVLRPAGVLYLTASARTGWGHAVHRALAGLGIDPGTHRPTTPARARGLVEQGGFEVIHLRHGSFRGARTRDLRSAEPGLIARAVLGLSEVVITIFAVKRAMVHGN